MKEILFGLASGIVAALGMGGGTILILLLSIFTQLKQHLIQRNKFNLFHSYINCCNLYEYKKQNN